MIHTIVRSLLDVLLPPAEAVVTCRSLSTRDIDAVLAPTEHHHITGLLPFAAPAVRALIHANKFHHDRHARTLLAYALIQALPQLTGNKSTVFVPIPLGPARARERGHNQVTSVLQAAITNHQPHLVIQNLLYRTRETPKQSQLDRRGRLTNVLNCFAYQAKPLPSEVTQIILVDDVVTTGATLASAADALRPHVPAGAKLTLLAFAY